MLTHSEYLNILRTEGDAFANSVQMALMSAPLSSSCAEEREGGEEGGGGGRRAQGTVSQDLAFQGGGARMHTERQEGELPSSPWP